MSRRPYVGIAPNLPEPLRATYEDQLAIVRPVAVGVSEAEAIDRIAAAMAQVFGQSYGLAHGTSSTLARLATTMAPRVAGQSRVDAAVDRCALQRALVLAGYAPALAPYWEAAARGAADGFTLDEALVLEREPGQDAGVPVIHGLPTLPAAPSIDIAAIEPVSSSLFQERYR